MNDADSKNDELVKDENGIVNDKVLMNNFESLRKKVFIKEKVEIRPSKVFKNNRITGKEKGEEPSSIV